MLSPSLLQHDDHLTLLLSPARCEFMGHTTPVRSALWHPHQEQLALTIEEGGIHRWDISDEGGVKDVGFAASSELLQLWDGAFHPSDVNLAVTCGGHNIQLWDLRTMQMTAQTAGAHRMPARDVSFAPRSEHVVVSGGDDCKLRLWDTRMISKGYDPLLELGGHSHWVWKAQFNPQYDQLVASSSSDSLVNLYHIPRTMAAAAAASSTEPASSDPSQSHGATSVSVEGGKVEGGHGGRGGKWMGRFTLLTITRIVSMASLGRLPTLGFLPHSPTMGGLLSTRSPRASNITSSSDIA